MVNAGLGVTICITYAASLVRLCRLEMRPDVADVIGKSRISHALTIADCSSERSRCMSMSAS